MRIELRDINNQAHLIDSENVATLLQWFEEKLPIIRDATERHMPCQIFIWPGYNMTMAGNNRPLQYVALGRDGFITLSNYFRDIADQS